MSLLPSIILASLGGAVASVCAAVALGPHPPRRLLDLGVAFAAGVLLSAALLDLIPEALEGGQLDPHHVGLTLLLGLVGFFAFERAALWRHDHSSQAVAPAVVVLGDAFHNFVDGVLIAAAFLTDPLLGWSTAIAVLIHELPQELGDYMLLRAAGLSQGRALLLNLLSSLAAVAGGVIGYFALGAVSTATPYALLLAAASFIYIAVSDLMPALRSHRSLRLLTLQGVAGTLGIAVMAVGALAAHR